MNPTNAPHAAHIPIGVASIHLPFVVQLNGDVQGVFWRTCPLKDLHHATGQSGYICYQHDRIHITAWCFACLQPLTQLAKCMVKHFTHLLILVKPKATYLLPKNLLQYMTMVNPAHSRHSHMGQPVWMCPVHLVSCNCKKTRVLLNARQQNKSVPSWPSTYA